ncbi:MAG: hypothetical protein ACI4PV_08795 [Butyricicoccus sp.]
MVVGVKCGGSDTSSGIASNRVWVQPLEHGRYRH